MASRFVRGVLCHYLDCTRWSDVVCVDSLLDRLSLLRGAVDARMAASSSTLRWQRLSEMQLRPHRPRGGFGLPRVRGGCAGCEGRGVDSWPVKRAGVGCQMRQRLVGDDGLTSFKCFFQARETGGRRARRVLPVARPFYGREGKDKEGLGPPPTRCCRIWQPTPARFAGEEAATVPDGSDGWPGRFLIHQPGRATDFPRLCAGCRYGVQG